MMMGFARHRLARSIRATSKGHTRLASCSLFTTDVNAPHTKDLKQEEDILLFGEPTLHHSFQRSVLTFPDNPCLGTINTGVNGKEFVFRSYKEVGESVNNFAEGLTENNFVGRNSEGLRTIGICMKNRAEWVVAEQASYLKGVVTVPIYDLADDQTIAFIINDTELKSIVCSVDIATKLLWQAGKCTSLEHLIITSFPSSTPVEGAITDDAVLPTELLQLATDKGVVLTLFSDVEAMGKRHRDSDVHSQKDTTYAPRPADLATFCYTSGTTGTPKGALITHQNIIAACTGGLSTLSDINSQDKYLSFLPLPHIFERLIVNGLLASGTCIGFYGGNPLKIMEDVLLLRPTVFCAVPRLLTKIEQKVIQNVNFATGFKGWLLRTALMTKVFAYRAKGHEQNHWLWDRLVFRKISGALGLDRVRHVVSGGAALTENTLLFYRILLGSKCVVHNGYGQTETSGATTLTTATDLSLGGVGVPIDKCKVRLVDVPEMGYSSDDTVHTTGEACNGRGEVQVSGPHVFQGYYKNPIQTAEAITEDGWLRSGDIGMWTAGTEGTEGIVGQGSRLSIIDRKSSLTKLSQGEYIAVERLENLLLSRLPLLSQLFIHGEASKDYLVAVAVPDPIELDRWTRAWVGMGGDEGDQEQQTTALVSHLVSEVTRLSRLENFKGYEYIRDLSVELSPWTITSGLLTPTLKPKRQALRKRYEKDILKMYKK